MPRHWIPSYFVGIVLLLLLPTQTPAQELTKEQAKDSQSPPSPNETTTLPEMVVAEQPEQAYAVKQATTATKTDTPILETPFSIQVVPQQILRDQQAYRIQDAIKNVSGVRQISTFSPVYETLLARGFGAEPFRDGNRVYFLTIPLANAERVEVLKGAAAINYGRIEPGGMVNVITKQPLDQPYYTLQQQFGSYNFYRTSLDLTGPLTQDHSLLYRLNFEYLDRDTFQRFTFQNRVFLNPSLTWRPTSKLEFNLSFEYRDEKATATGGFPALGNRPAPVPITRSFGDKGLNDHFFIYATYLKGTYKINDDWTIRSGAGIWQGDYHYGGFVFGSVDPETHTVQRGILTSDFDHRDNYDVYLDLVGHVTTFGLDHSVLLGTDYSLFDSDANWFGNSSGQVFIPPLDIFQPVYGGIDFAAVKAQQPDAFFVRTRDWNSVYFQDQIALGDHVRLLGGGRYDWSAESFGFASTSLKDARNQRAEVTTEQFSPRVGLLYLPWPWLSVYWSYAESFGGTNSGRSRTNQTFEPETADQHEFGAKAEFYDGRLRASVTFYELTKQNILTPDPVDPEFSVQIGEARSRGVEVDVAGQLSKGLSLIASYAYTDTKITEDNSGNQGHQLANAPYNIGSVWLKYDVPPSPLQGLSLGAGVYTVSRSQGNTENTFKLPGYTRVDLYTAYAWEWRGTRMIAQLNIDNAFDKRYFAASSYDADILPGEPFMTFGSLRVEY